MKTLLPILVLSVIAIDSLGSLVDAWSHSPYDQLGLVTFLLWGFVVLLGARGEDYGLRSWGYLGCLVAILGVVLDLNVLKHVALGLAAANLVGGSCARFTILLSSLCWMPAMGYLGARCGVAAELVAWLRVGGATCVILFQLHTLFRVPFLDHYLRHD